MDQVLFKSQKTIGGRYSECGLLVEGDARGVVNHHPIQFIRVLEVTVTDQTHQKRLSINSSVGVLIIHNVRTPDVKWPLVLGRNGDAREISTAEKCVVLGNKE